MRASTLNTRIWLSRWDRNSVWYEGGVQNLWISNNLPALPTTIERVNHPQNIAPISCIRFTFFWTFVRGVFHQNLTWQLPLMVNFIPVSTFSSSSLRVSSQEIYIWYARRDLKMLSPAKFTHTTSIIHDGEMENCTHFYLSYQVHFAYHVQTPNPPTQPIFCTSHKAWRHKGLVIFQDEKHD